MKLLGYIFLGIIGYTVFCLAFDPWGGGAEHRAQQARATVICKDELGIAVYKGSIMNPAYSRCLKQTAMLIKQGSLD